MLKVLLRLVGNSLIIIDLFIDSVIDLVIDLVIDYVINYKYNYDTISTILLPSLLTLITFPVNTNA